MPKVGDRVVIDGTKVGAQRREGSLVGMTGRLIKVRWNDGTESLLTPGAGAATFLPGRAPAKQTTSQKAPAAKAKPAAKGASPAAKKPSSKKAGGGAKKTSGSAKKR